MEEEVRQGVDDPARQSDTGSAVESPGPSSPNRNLPTASSQVVNKSDSETKIQEDETRGEKSGELTTRVTRSDTTATLTDPESCEDVTAMTGRKTPETTRTRTPDSSRPKSSSSGEVMFEAKRRKRKTPSAPNAHTVNFTVNVAMAIPTVEDDYQPDLKEMMKKKKRVFEAPRAQNYYHIEYYILPEEDELTKTDIVTYGMASKIYMERHDPRVIKTWQDGEITWIAWANSHSVTVTKEVLLKMFNHRLELRVWDTKDKVSTRARFDRPKAFRLPQAKPGEDADDIGGVKSNVLKQSRSFTKMQPKKGAAVRPLPSRISCPKMDGSSKRKGFGHIGQRDSQEIDEEKLSETEQLPDQDNKAESPTSPLTQPEESHGSPTPQTLVGIPNKAVEGQDVRTFSRLGRLAGAERPTQSPSKDSKMSKASHDKMQQAKSRSASQSSKSRKTHPSQSPPPTARSNLKSGESEFSGVVHKDRDSPSRHRRNKKAEAAAQAAAEYVKKFGICVVPIPMSLLFSDMKSITGRLDSAVPGIEDIFITVSLDGSLMSEVQKEELNPMIIKIHSATNLPETPMSYSELRMKCQPVYCKYKFYKQPSHVSSGKEHSRKIYWDDINVVLLGTLEPSELREFLNGPPMDIEIHDRDRKKEDIKLKATLFGDDLEDEKISNVGTVTSRRTLHNPFRGRDKPWDPHGVAKLDLSELLLGHRYLHLKLPIHNCRIPDVLGGDGKHDGKLIGIAGAVDGPVDRPLSAGHYLHASASLKVKIELANPLTTPAKVASKQPLQSTFECPFGRIVFIFEYKNVAVLHKLQNLVTSINAHALELDDMPQHVINAALSTYKLSVDQQNSRDLDIVTGFQILDGKMHLFVLEGLRDKAIHVLWEALPQPEKTDVKVLFNSDLSFNSRLYGPLDVDLCRVKLHEPLSIITQQSLLYVRDMVPKPCYQALVKLEELQKIKKFRDAVRNELFPTAEMVISMSKEFGVPLTTEDFEELQPESDKIPETEQEKIVVSRPQTSRMWTPIDNFNPGFLEKMVAREEKGPSVDYLKENIADVQARSAHNKLEREKTKPPTVMADVVVPHNYSTSTLNSTDLAKEKLRQMLEQNSDTRYTYCQDYHHSMTVVPVNTEALRKKAELESHSKWRTLNGFIYPGMKSMQESNIHPKHPDEAQSEELTHPWRENILHVNILQSPLARDRYPWNIRHHDLELYRRPVPNFGHNDPITIHLAGEKLRQERLAAKKIDADMWRSKIVVDDPRHYTHRCLTETELKIRGFTSSNQIDRLKGLLKDAPVKHTLKKPGLTLKEIPPLNVVLNPSVDTDSRAAGVPLYPAVDGEGIETTKGFKPGPLMDSSWLMEKNKIPAHDYEHSKFAQLKCHDFNVYHTERRKLWKRPIYLLTEEERDNHLFRIPDDPEIFGPVDISGFDLGTRSMTLPVAGDSSQVTFTSRSPEIIQQTENRKVLEPIVT